MGDTGSMFHGFVLSVKANRTSLKLELAVAIIVPIVTLGFPIADTHLAVVRRAMRGAPLLGADLDHLHHRFLSRGLSHRQILLVLHAAPAGLGLVALALARASGWPAAVFLIGRHHGCTSNPAVPLASPTVPVRERDLVARSRSSTSVRTR